MKRNLTLRRTYHDHPNPEDNDRFWSVDCDGCYVASLVLHQGRSDEPPEWRWAIHMHPGRSGNGARHLGATSGRADSRDAALPDIRRALECYLAFIGDDGWALHVKHMAWSKEQRARWRRQRQGLEQGGYG